MGNFYTDVIRKDLRFPTTSVVSDTELLEPGTRAAVAAVLHDAQDAGLNVKLLETYRSQKRQAELYLRRATKLKTVGCHGYGLAADFGLYDFKGKYIADAAPYKALVALCRKHGLISGYDWGNPDIKHTFIDAGHVQRIPVFRQDAVFAGGWYPNPTYNPYLDHPLKG